MITSKEIQDTILRLEQDNGLGGKEKDANKMTPILLMGIYNALIAILQHLEEKQVSTSHKKAKTGTLAEVLTK